jgi:hypothetical protein
LCGGSAFESRYRHRVNEPSRASFFGKPLLA